MQDFAQNWKGLEIKTQSIICPLVILKAIYENVIKELKKKCGINRQNT